LRRISTRAAAAEKSSLNDVWRRSSRRAPR
jgi:hypothetical protein